MRSLRSTIAALAVIPLLATACASDGDATADPANAGDDPTTEVDTSPTADEDPTSEDPGDGELETTELAYAIFSTGVPSRHVLAAEELGYFDEAGLDVEIVQAGSPGDVIPLLSSGGADLAYLGYESGFNAVNAGLDARLVRSMQINIEGGQQLWANKGAGIETIADLEGKSVAVGGIGGFGDYLLAETLATEGMTLDDITLTEVPFPALISTIAEGQVDAGWLPGPFAAAMQAAGPGAPLDLVVDFEDIPSLEGAHVGGLWGMQPWLEEHPNTVRAFVDVLDRIAAEFEADPELDREQLAVLLPEMEPAVVERHALYPYPGEVSVDELQSLQEKFVEYGILDQPVDVDSVVHTVE